MPLDSKEFKNLEKEYLIKLKNYTHHQRILNDELNKYINNENTSVKNKKFGGQNIFVTSLNGDIKSKSLGCHNVDIKDWRFVDMSSNNNIASNCKKYAILNDEKYYGLQDFSNNQKCFVTKNKSSIKKLTKHFSKLYWESPDYFAIFYNFFKIPDPAANVLTLGFNDSLANFTYDTSKKWFSEDGIKRIHFFSIPNSQTGKDCGFIYGGTVTDINALYGNNCKTEWNQYIGQEQATKIIGDQVLHTNGKNLLINKDLLGTPCPNSTERNNIRIQYRCGKTKYKTIDALENEHVNINCDNLKDLCPTHFSDVSTNVSKNFPPIIRLSDSGDLCIYKSVHSKNPVWCLSSDFSNIEQILSVPKIKGIYKSGLESDSGFKQENKDFKIGGKLYSNTKWLSGRDYLSAGEPFQTGMLLASKSGTCCLRLNKEGKIQLFYSSQSCSKVDGNLYGNAENILEISEFAHGKDLNNLGKMGYVIGYGKDSDKIREYPDNLINFSHKFSDPIKNRNFDYKNGEALTNVSLKGCKERCIDKGNDCLGVSWIKNKDKEDGGDHYRKYDDSHHHKIHEDKEHCKKRGDKCVEEHEDMHKRDHDRERKRRHGYGDDDGELGTCYYSHAKSYNKLFSGTKFSKDTEFMYRIPELMTGSSCGKMINDITNKDWYNYELDGKILDEKMSKFDKCGLGLATEKARHSLDVSYKELKDTVDKISEKLRHLTENERKNIDKTGENVKKLKESIKSFKTMEDVHDKNMTDYNSYSKIREDTESKLFSSNNKYLFWSLLALSFALIVLSLNK